MFPLQIKRHVSFEELKNLFRKTDKKSLAIRYLAILKMYEGEDAPKAAREVYVTPQSVRNWVHRWNEQGPKGLIPEPQSGRPPVLKEEEREVLINDVLKSPREIDYDFSTWTLKAIVGHVKKKFGKEMSISGVDRMLKRENLSRVVPRPMPAKADPQKKLNF